MSPAIRTCAATIGMVCVVFVAVAGAQPPLPNLLTSVAPNTWAPAGSMAYPRRDHSATVLKDGKVLIVGWYTREAEVYDPVAGTSRAVGQTIFSHDALATATLLRDGTVLIAGGTGASTSAEIYDPVGGTFRATGSLQSPHFAHTATLLPDGSVLIAAGGYYDNGPVVTSAIAEVYDPVAGAFTLVGQMNVDRDGAVATLLPDGRVLIAGGTVAIKDQPGYGYCTATAELYDATMRRFTRTAGDMTTPRCSLWWGIAPVLASGKVLIAGGQSFDGQSADLFDPAAGTFSATGRLLEPQAVPSVAMMSDGRVLLTGGYVPGASATNICQIYDPATGAFSYAAPMLEARLQHTATLLADGRVLVAGGYGGETELSSLETYSSVNRPPVLEPVGPQVLNEGTRLWLPLHATDPDGDALTYAARNLPRGAEFYTSVGILMFYPDFTQAGEYLVEFIVTDSRGAATTETVAITVRNITDPPVCAPIAAQTVEVYQRIRFPFVAADPEGEPLTYRFVFFNQGNTDKFDYNTRFFDWIPGQSDIGTYTARFYASDPHYAECSVTVPITVTRASYPTLLEPVWVRQGMDGEMIAAYDAGMYVTGHQVVNGVSTGHVSLYDAAGNLLWRRAVGSPIVGITADAAGAVVLELSRITRFGPAGDQRWSTPVDGYGKAIAGDATGTYLAREAAFSLDGYLCKYDAAGNQSWCRLLGVEGRPAGGMALDSTGVYITVDDPGLSGSVCKYDAAGSRRWCRQIASSSGVQGVRLTGIATDSSGVYVTGDRGSITEDFVRKYDADGNQLWHSAINSLRLGGDVPAIATDGRGVYFTGRHDWGPGLDSDVNISRIDAAGNVLWGLHPGTPGWDTGIGVAANTTGVYVTGRADGPWPGAVQTGGTNYFVAKLAPPDKASPSLAAIGHQSVSEGQTLQFVIRATDPDGDPVSYRAINLPPGSRLDADTGTFAWTPDYAQAGEYVVDFVVIDNQFGAAAELVTITVTNTNRPPVFDPVVTPVVEAYQQVRFSAMARDPDGGVPTYSTDGLPAGASIDPVTRVFTWIPRYDQTGIHTVTFTARDVDGGVGERRMSIVVTAATSASRLLDATTTIVISRLPVTEKLKDSYKESIRKAVELAAAGKTPAAIAQLTAFIAKVNADIRQRLISEAAGRELIAMARAAIKLLSP